MIIFVTLNKIIKNHNRKHIISRKLIKELKNIKQVSICQEEAFAMQILD